VTDGRTYGYEDPFVERGYKNTLISFHAPINRDFIKLKHSFYEIFGKGRQNIFFLIKHKSFF
jgi:hypothetical protein